MTKYEIRDDSGTTAIVEARGMEQAERKARKWLLDGSWDRDRTLWLDARVERMFRGEPTGEYSRVTVTLQPEEPECCGGRIHDWRSPFRVVGGIRSNPGVWGHGGGVVIHEVCIRCGCGRITDTWATRPDTGQQGVTSVEYRPGMYCEKLLESEVLSE